MLTVELTDHRAINEIVTLVVDELHHDNKKMSGKELTMLRPIIQIVDAMTDQHDACRMNVDHTLEAKVIFY